MNFEELEKLWTNQPAPAIASIDVAALKRSVQPELRRRSRMLAYELGTNLLGVVLLPVLAIANYRYDPVSYGSLWSWAQIVGQMLVVLLWVTFSLRRLMRHRALRQRSADSVRTVTELSVANLEAEMSDCRFWQRPLFWLALGGVIAALIGAGVRHGWEKTALPAGLGAFALLGVVCLIVWRHYRVNLLPAYRQQREILRQLG